MIVSGYFVTLLILESCYIMSHGVMRMIIRMTWCWERGGGGGLPCQFNSISAVRQIVEA